MPQRNNAVLVLSTVSDVLGKATMFLNQLCANHTATAMTGEGNDWTMEGISLCLHKNKYFHWMWSLMLNAVSLILNQTLKCRVTRYKERQHIDILILSMSRLKSKLISPIILVLNKDIKVLLVSGICFFIYSNYCWSIFFGTRKEDEGIDEVPPAASSINITALWKSADPGMRQKELQAKDTKCLKNCSLSGEIANWNVINRNLADSAWRAIC